MSNLLRKSRRGYLWVTLALFLASLAGHWVLAWKSYVHESQEHARQPTLGDFAVTAGRDTLENWQSEFLQLIWQVAGLAVLLHVGSPQSREGHDRVEAKLDFLLAQAEKGEEAQRRIDREFLRDET